MSWFKKEKKPKAIIVDLDGTLSDDSWRKHLVTDGNKKWNEYMAGHTKDLPIPEMVHAVRGYKEAGYAVIILSMRWGHMLGEVHEWLNRVQVPYDWVILRPKDEWGPGNEVKRQMFRKAIKPYYDVHFAFDDKQEVVNIWNEEGIEGVLV